MHKAGVAENLKKRVGYLLRKVNFLTMKKMLSLTAAVLFAAATTFAVTGDWKLIPSGTIISNQSDAVIKSTYCPGANVRQCAVLLDEFGQETSTFVLKP